MAEPIHISVKRSDDVAFVVEQLIDAESEQVIFEIAPGAIFGQLLNNFKLLKREASLLKREVIIETTDLGIRERAARSGLGIIEQAVVGDDGATGTKSAKPRAGRSRSVRVQVVPENEERPRRATRSRAEPAASRRVSRDSEPENELTPDGDSAEPDVSFIQAAPARATKSDVMRRTQGEPIRPNRRSRRKILFLISGAIIVGLAIVSYVAAAVLPHAEITVVTEKKNWSFDGSIGIDKALTSIDESGSRAPGQIFVVRDSFTKRVPATGKKYVSIKATANLTVYNGYSSQPQSIVANTRFVTPAGIIFRTASPLIIPGAKIENGKIIPSTISVPVVADKPGAEANLGQTAKLTIPGFLKTPKYDGFYGELKEGASGGFVGETSVPTEKDVVAAKEQGIKTVTEQLQQKIAGSVPAEFKVLPGATKVTVLKQVVESVSASDGTVGVVTEAQLSILAFRESDLRLLLTQRLKNAIGKDFKVDSDTLVYGTLNPKTIALGSGRMSVPIKYDVSLSRIVSAVDIAQKLAGQPDTQLNALVFAIEGISGGKVTLKPFYVHTVPSDLDKIAVIIQ